MMTASKPIDLAGQLILLVVPSLLVAFLLIRLSHDWRKNPRHFQNVLWTVGIKLNANDIQKHLKEAAPVILPLLFVLAWLAMSVGVGGLVAINQEMFGFNMPPGLTGLCVVLGGLITLFLHLDTPLPIRRLLRKHS